MGAKAEVLRIFYELQHRHFVEFSVNGISYLIQPDNNKGCDYLSLWRTGIHPVCLGNALYEMMDGIDLEAVQDLLQQPLIRGETYLSLWEQGLIHF